MHYIFDSDAAARPQTRINKGSLLFVTLQTVEDGRERTARPVLFEMAPGVMPLRAPMGDLWIPDTEPMAGPRNFMLAQRYAGYDYAITPSWPYDLLQFKHGGRGNAGHHTRSQNEGAMIKDESSFASYEWPALRPEEYERMAELRPFVPEGMKLIMRSPGGIQEQTVDLLGFENLCLMLFDEPALVEAVVAAVGERMVRHFDLALEHDFIGAGLLSDDWGFKTGTMLPPDKLRELIMPWHRKVVETIHSKGKAAILHSCGQLSAVMDDIIDDLRYDAKHSFEDTITPIEDAYARWGGRIALLGGIDMDFLARATPDRIHARCREILARTAGQGGYALGSGNSIADYIPAENYFAMLTAALV